MQIDFHHTTTYVLARMAGFSHNDADIIAYASQYVDDSTNGGPLKFKDGPVYYRAPSAHTMGDLGHHLNTAENYIVWSIFHFLPGNQGKSANDSTEISFYEKIICKPDSEIAHRMIDECVKYIDEEYTLQRLGITMHVYADTYAHQEFAGIVHEINSVKDVVLKNEHENTIDDIKSELISRTFAMGHGAVLTHPDKPYLEWSYINYKGDKVERNNTEIFIAACRQLLKELIKYKTAQDNNFVPDATDNERDINKIQSNFETFKEPEGEDRHKRWLESIANGDFSFGPQEINYIAKGEGSWKYKALGEYVEDDADGDYQYTFTSAFMKSNYKKFHDAIQEHRLTILHDILPDYNICLA